MWDDIEYLKKRILKEDWIDFNEKKFVPIQKRNYPIEKYGKPTLWYYEFSHNATRKYLQFTPEMKKDVEKFLKTWNLKDLPKSIKLVD